MPMAQPLRSGSLPLRFGPLPLPEIPLRSGSMPLRSDSRFGTAEAVALHQHVPPDSWRVDKTSSFYSLESDSSEHVPNLNPKP